MLMSMVICLGMCFVNIATHAVTALDGFLSTAHESSDEWRSHPKSGESET